mmetsp:Transcript_29062/g.43915  ORF Transcript_29062/g.43915 Transcript_29062/m.43915 type:complete len:144 (+) Transcript_29062:185-616(+)|eukprot:CAMPEP_0178926228 /NCGR_PEP_ID=MMETSP0786-20121207/18399_1 /TAXON_ID=186022 /ORGANISM="Thalassionema frauenfeldii, Strain CCMP 1798" /LENGTH=143 /DNA_ID=CAMNT_0020601293 /DNA_START=105 /DNA_END=536 /DNA_ORIENTATION=+
MLSTRIFATPTITRRCLSTSSSAKPSLLAGDAGPLATHTYHTMNTVLMGATPLYFLLPTGGFVDKAFGSVLAVTIAGHSWVGMNYVITDYVPKFFSKSWVGPARVVNAGIGVVTLLGLGAIAFNEQGGIKGCLGALWTKKKTE